MKPQVEEAIEAELLKRAQKDLKHVAITMVREGPGVIINEPLKSRYDKILHGYADRNSILGSEEVTPASAAFNRTRYALANVKDLGAGTLVRAIGDLWREGGGTCVRKDIAEEAIVNQMMIGTPGQPKIEAGLLLSATCGTLTPAGGRVALHGLGAFAERLKEGHEYKPVGAKLAGINLSGLDLSGVQLREADLSHALFVGVRLSESDLAGANLSYASFDDAVVNGVDFSNANFLRTRCVRTKFSHANMTGVSLIGTSLDMAVLANVRLSDAQFSDTWCWGTIFKHVAFDSATLSNSGFSGATLEGHDLSGLQAQTCNFNAANLHLTRLVETDLEDATFVDADLSSADLRGADLRGAQISGANLKLASLRGAMRRAVDAPIPGWVLVDGRLQPAERKRR